VPPLTVPKQALASLPAFVGGKREVAPAIFRAVAQAGFPPGRGHTLADAFLGGGSVSLLGKLLGYRVAANDVALRSQVVAEALLLNDRVRFDEADLVRALERAGSKDAWITVPVRDWPFPERAREVFTGLVAAAEGFANPTKAALLRLIVFKTIMRMAPRSQVNVSSTTSKRVREERWDDLSEYDRRQNVARLTQPTRFLVEATRQVNAGVFPGQAEFHRGDALAWLAGRDADVLYLDPPYPGTTHYERHFLPVDMLLENRVFEMPRRSRFSDPDGWRNVGELLDAGAAARLWVLSVSSSSVDVEDVMGLVEDRGRRAEVYAQAHEHFRGLGQTERARTNQELIIVAKAT
jgi:hypothetical protein